MRELQVERFSLIGKNVSHYRIHEEPSAGGKAKGRTGGPSMISGPYLERK